MRREPAARGNGSISTVGPRTITTLDANSIREIPEEIRNRPIRRIRSGDGAEGVGLGTVVYENDTIPERAWAPGAFVEMADDMLLASFTNERELLEYNGILVISDGGAFDVSTELWTDIGTGGAPAFPISGTDCVFFGLDPGVIWELVCTPDHGIKIP